jgi:hypothetical protein
MPFPDSDSSQSATTFADEMRLIPRWSVAAAVFAFVGMQYIFWVVMPDHRHHEPPPFGLRLYLALSWSALAALYMLMVGYVYRDTERRGMQARIWIIVCLVLPGGIGAVLYFLLRQPLISLCPACSTRVQSEYHYCPQCAFQITASCGRCFRGVRPSDLFCVHCGHDRASDNTPARLLAFRD